MPSSQQAKGNTAADLEGKVTRFQAALAGIRRQQEESIHLLYHEVEELFERNCGRLRYDLTEGLEENARDIAGELRIHAEKGYLMFFYKAR
ncbi:hypothetical protein CEB3_c37100 [Peptococcaceae bacterium CEB3]|nr:hypothetical protein CEB3_c37100 [Peptococcaceae bacterium CEB3]